VAGKGINLNEVQESQPYGWAYEDFTIYMKDGHCQKMCTHRSFTKGGKEGDIKIVLLRGS
jgi:hypothetical protein